MSNSAKTSAPLPWNMAEMRRVPRTFPAPEWEQPGVRAVWIEGVPYHGKATRALAYYGVPAHAPDEKVPAIILVHGGGGTAFPDWVKQWNIRGYAAISVDNSGNVPDKTNYYNGKPIHDELGGPPGWGGIDAQIDEPIGDQWTYHAVADVLMSTSFLAAQEGVDKNKIGITGISWGGYLTCIVAGIDTRLKFAVPVYGCGFLGDDSAWVPNFAQLGPERAAKWLALWDPSHYVWRAKIPFLWVTGTNDFAYPLSSLQKTYELLPPRAVALAIRVRMPHGHGGSGENPEEIRAFADAIFKKGVPLTRIVSQKCEGETATVNFRAATPPQSAELNFTKDAGAWSSRNWETIPAQLDAKTQTATATIPGGATVYYFNIIDENGLVASSPHVEIPAAK